MRKSLVAIGAALLLLGAGCGGGEASGGVSFGGEIDALGETAQRAVDALVVAGEAMDEKAAQALVLVPIDDITVAGIAGYFSVISNKIDHGASRLSDDQRTYELISKDGVSLGTWRDVSVNGTGEWKATSAFWFE